MLKKIMILLVLMLGGIQTVFAGSGYSYEDGRGLAGVCEGDSNFDRGVCHSYLIAIHDAHGSLAYAGALGAKQFCTPDGVEVGVLKEAFLTYAGHRSDELHRTASSLVIDAYRIAFPCN